MEVLSYILCFFAGSIVTIAAFLLPRKSSKGDIDHGEVPAVSEEAKKQETMLAQFDNLMSYTGDHQRGGGLIE